MKKLIDNFKTFNNRKLNENNIFDLIRNIELSIDEKMDELIGRGDYTIGYSEEQDRFIVSFRKGDIESSCDMADEVVDFVNIERTVLRIGNCDESMFWLTWVDK